MSLERHRVIVKFRAEYRADNGFRVYATEPTGLYVSSESTYAAAEYFMNLVPCVVAGIAKEKKMPGIELLTSFNWEEIARKGGGECVFELASKSEMEMYGPEPEADPSRTEGDFPPMAGEEPGIAEIGLRVVRRQIGSKQFLVATDPGEKDTVLEEVIKQYERVQ